MINFLNNTVKSTPEQIRKSTPLALIAQHIKPHRNHVGYDQIIQLATEKYKTKYGKGITYQDLLDVGFVQHKKQAQDTLKYHLRKGDLFVLRHSRPQQYFPSNIKSEIMKNSLNKNTPICPSGVGFSNVPISRDPLANCLEPVILETLEGYILPLLPKAPLFIHNLHFKTKVNSECYSELNLQYYRQNNGKYHQEVVGKSLVTYVFYKSGTVEIMVLCSNNPYKLETEEDRSRILAFFGQIRSGLISVLYDKHERIVPDILQWGLTECDINKDIKVSDLFHFTAIKIQVRHLDHLFRIYIKAMGKDTICRVEENKHPKKRAVEFINNVFNFPEKLESYLKEYDKKLDEIIGLLKDD